MSAILRVSIVVIKHITKSSLGKKGFILLIPPHHCLSLKEVRAGTCRREVTQRPWTGATYWLAPADFLSLPSQRTQARQFRSGVVNCHSELGLPTSVRKIHHRLIHTHDALMETLSQIRCSFQMTSLCQDDIN